MSTKPGTGRVRSAYEFIEVHRDRYSVQTTCRVLAVAPSGYYAWRSSSSRTAQEDAKLLCLIGASAVASHGIYAATRLFRDSGGSADARGQSPSPARLPHPTLVTTAVSDRRRFEGPTQFFARVPPREAANR